MITNNPRILVVDDEEKILESYQRVLEDNKISGFTESRFAELGTRLFGTTPPESSGFACEVVTCRQGTEAVEAVSCALSEERPFAIAFIDVRMPPGPDGIWAAERIRSLDEHIQLVMVTAYSDVAPYEIARRVPPPDKLLYVQKPFHPQEIQQFAACLSAKWSAERFMREYQKELEERVRQRTVELTQANEQLIADMEKRRLAEEALRRKETELVWQARKLEEVNTALTVLLERRVQEKQLLETDIHTTLDKLVNPYLTRLAQGQLSDEQRSILEIIENNLANVTSSFASQMSTLAEKLTPSELEVADLLRNGKTTKEIARLLNLSLTTIAFHRRNIRKKLGITNKKTHLISYLRAKS